MEFNIDLNNNFPKVDDNRSKEKCIKFLNDKIEILKKYKNVMEQIPQDRLTSEFLIEIFDNLKGPDPREKILNEDAEFYLQEMESTVLLHLRDLILKLQNFVKLPKLGKQSTDLLVEVYEDHFNSFLESMKKSLFDHSTGFTPVKRFPKTGMVEYHQFETDDLELVEKLIDSFNGFSSSSVLQCHRLHLASKGNPNVLKYLDKSYVENMTGFKLLETAKSIGLNVLSPITVSSTNVIFGKYTKPGWEKLDQEKLVGKKILVANNDKECREEQNKIDTNWTTPSNNDNNQLDTNTATIINDNNKTGSSKKRKRIPVGRFKIVYYRNVYQSEGISWLVFKCKFSQSNKGIVQFRDN